MGIKLGSISRRVLKIIWVPVILAILLVTPVDDKGFMSTRFYESTINRLDSLSGVLEGQESGPIQIGWAAANITPQQPVRLTGKQWSPYVDVFDSVYVRVFIFSSGSRKIALLSYDLWIIHPHLAAAIREKVQAADVGITGIYFTANHSHTSIGGWGSGILGTLVVGGNHPETVSFLEECTLNALQQAQANLQPATLGYGETDTENMVANRLDAEGALDEKLRLLKMRNASAEQAIFTTFSAHSVFMSKDLNTLSADYSGPFITYMEDSDSIDFACFAPGATGSHTPLGRKPFEYAKMEAYAQKLTDQLLATQAQIYPDSTEVLKFVEWPVDLRSPHFRITNHWRIRPWIFNAVMGKTKASITALKVGNTVLVGLPVELSGEFYGEFDAICKSRGLNLMITPFNGDYLGYVNPEKYYYTLNKPETREMNWFGPQNGEYFVALIKELLAVI